MKYKKINTYSKSTMETLKEGVRCSKLTITREERWPCCQWSPAEFFIGNFDYVSYLVLVFLLLTLDMYLLAGIDQYNTAYSKEVSNQGTALFPTFLGGYSTFPNRKKVPCKLSSQFTSQQSWLRNEHSHFQMYTCFQLHHSYSVFFYLNM